MNLLLVLIIVAAVLLYVIPHTRDAVYGAPVLASRVAVFIFAGSLVLAASGGRTRLILATILFFTAVGVTMWQMESIKCFAVGGFC